MNQPRAPAVDAFERQQRVHELLLERRRDGVPRREALAPLVDALDERVEGLLGVGQAGCLVTGRDRNRGTAACGHDVGSSGRGGTRGRPVF
jgi:hypothetical protein